MAPDVSPLKAGVPVAISYNTTPNENKSDRASNGLPSTCSGDMYATVPTMEPGLVKSRASSESVGASGAAMSVDDTGDTTFANPKSRIFALPLSVTK
ncbi:MAG TPA: hypothetical protein VFV92_16625, partial [Candidatus Bathyarchaeia archaeon]|nr:hypothetical protein [Candidatus Bathyarchaeia archaeon]